MRNVRLVLWLAVAIALFGLGALAVTRSADRGGPIADNSRLQPGAPLGGAFSLLDHNGATVTEAILRGKPSAVFFGFTHCPDVCPTTLMEAAGWIEALGPDADMMRFVFVTVDPERDTPQVLSEYLSAFSPKIVGVTGEPENVWAMAKDHAKKPAVDESGRIVARDQMTLSLVCDHRILYGADGAQFLARVKELLEKPLSLAL